ncbi:MAG TPA: H-X9-DG-CTERM domain-containing protein [Blastocatellia bacterium]
MKRYIARQILIARLTVLTLCALCFLRSPIQAQGMTGYTVIFPSVGLAPGQSLRLTLFNPNGAPVRAQAQVHHSGGIQIALADGSVRLIQAGAFHSFDFNHFDIPMPCYENTCRKQILPSVSITFSETIKPVVASMEIIEVKDGTSNALLLSERRISPAGGGDDSLTFGSGSDALVGIAPGQTLRVTLFNPPSSGSETQRGPVNGRVRIFDGGGALIEQSEDLVIRPGTYHSFDINRDAIPIYGEPGANRLQARIKPSFDGVLASFEIIDNRTGKTVTLSHQECLVFYLSGTPDNEARAN